MNNLDVLSEEIVIVGSGNGELADVVIPLFEGSHYTVNININKFEKPIGAVILSGGDNEIKDIIEIKKG